MRKLIISAVALFLVFQVSAQEPTYKFGKIQPNDVLQAQFSKILAYDEDGLFMLKEKGPITQPTYIIEKYSKEFDNVQSQKIKAVIGVFNESILLDEIMYNGTDFFVFFNGWSKSKLESSYELKKYNKNLELTSTEKVLNRTSAKKNINSGFSVPVFSPDYSKMMLFTQLPFVKKANEQIRLTVFDTKTLEQIWTKDITLDNISKRGIRNEVLVDNNGNAYVFKKIKQPKNMYDYQLFTCSAKDQSWKKTSFSANGLYIKDYRLLINQKNEFVINALFSTKMNGKLLGSLYCRIDGNTLDVAAQKSEYFSTDLLCNWMSPKAAEKEGAGLNMKYKIKDCLSLSDGKNVILVEYVSETKKNIAAEGNPPVYQYSNTRKDIFAICINTNGEQVWSSYIKKNQLDVSKDPSKTITSFTYTVVNDEIYILWNNMGLTNAVISSLKWQDDKGMTQEGRKAFNSATVASPCFLHMIDKNGNVTYAKSTFGKPLYHLHDGAPFNLSINSEFFLPLSDGILIIGEMNNKKRYRFGTVKF